jgi:hypothetical protein
MVTLPGISLWCHMLSCSDTCKPRCHRILTRLTRKKSRLYEVVKLIRRTMRVEYVQLPGGTLIIVAMRSACYTLSWSLSLWFVSTFAALPSNQQLWVLRYITIGQGTWALCTRAFAHLDHPESQHELNFLSESLGLWILSIVRNAKWLEKQHFGN